jgi:ATP adenylyltransferase
MQTLWAPWRIDYILSEKPAGCIFCEKSLTPSTDKQDFVIYRGTSAFVLMNIYPYNNGHLMIAPYAHVPSLTELLPAQLTEVFLLTQLCETVLRHTFQPEGFNIGINLGKVAGAGIETHLHVHIVPRWNGDTNYMTAISHVRVIPQALEQAYQQLQPAFLKIAAQTIGEQNAGT